MIKFERQGSEGYVQINKGGLQQPEQGSFPPVTQRVGQSPDPYRTFDEYGTLRTTVQPIDHCNLRCPGCYAKQYLPHGRDLGLIDPTRRKQTPVQDFRDQLAAHGSKVQEVYFLGLEPTIDPPKTREMLQHIHDQGMGSVVATNGAYSSARFEETFREALDTGQLRKVNISVDSMDRDIHNRLRGRSFAFDRTLETIKHAVETGVPVQITMTVWADNYHTILESVEKLYEMGVRGFVFHEGSLEGAPDYQDTITRRISPLAWRALTAKFEELKEKYAEPGDMEHFLYPYIYFTKEELRQGVIGDDALTDEYLQHVERLENGEESSLPFHACPAVDVPQVYLFGNDGPTGEGAISLCSIHTGATGTYLANYDGQSRRFLPILDPEQNQMQQMMSSPNLCPARQGAHRDGNPSDRNQTEAGDIFHACRYISSNQLPLPDKTFGREHYDTIAEYYEIRWDLLRRDSTVLQQIDQIDTSRVSHADKLSGIKILVSSIHGK